MVNVEGKTATLKNGIWSPRKVLLFLSDLTNILLYRQISVKLPHQNCEEFLSTGVQVVSHGQTGMTKLQDAFSNTRICEGA